MIGVTILILGVTFWLHVLAKWAMGSDWILDWNTTGQLAALWGTVLMAWSFVLSSRTKIGDKIFGGQDKIIKLHQWVGIGAFVLLMHHPILLAIDSLPYFELVKKYLFFSEEISFNLGVAALFLMIILIGLTVVVNLPYDLWLKTHDWLGGVLLLGMIHMLIIESDVSRYLPLRIWMIVVVTLGVTGFVYKVFLYKILGPKYKYQVTSVKKKGVVTEIELMAENEEMTFTPGQFVYISFGQKGLEEEHPFSISSSINEKVLRFSAKALGDYTTKLGELKTGTRATVWGSYGRLGDKFRSNNQAVMVAGGIGITPFLSMIGSEIGRELPRKMMLFYCANTETELVYDEEIKRMKKKLANFEYYGMATNECGRITGRAILEKVENKNKCNFYLCGPRGMMESVAKQLASEGVKRRKIIFEDFAFKI